MNENKENIELAYYEAETARIHKELVEGAPAEIVKVTKEKRTASDNCRSIND